MTEHIQLYNNKVLELINQIKSKRIVSSRAKTLIQFIDNFINSTKKEFSIKVYKITIVFPNETNLSSWFTILDKREKILQVLIKSEMPLAYLIVGIEMHRSIITKAKKKKETVNNDIDDDHDTINDIKQNQKSKYSSC